jgi:hypothetical protein
MMAERDPSKTAAAILALGAPETGAEGEEPASGEVELDSGGTALEMAASDWLSASQANDPRGMAEAFRQMFRAMRPED